MNDKRYWIGFNLVKGIGAVRMRALLAYFDSLEDAWNAPAEQLQEAGLSPRLAESAVNLRAKVDLEKIWNQIEKQGISVLTWDDELYPPRLKEIEQPPPVLYARGEITLDDHYAVAIVGTRRVTPYGRQIAEDLAAFLAGQGITVVSGLARGVDAVAHSAALKAGGRTIAVLGSGVDKIYPPEHLQIAEKMMKQGAVVSDYAVGTPPESANFPPRNRIIAGLSLAVVLVEAGEASGALITADFATEQGREVFAVPGSIHSPASRGTNRLIRSGARPLVAVDEVLEALNLDVVARQEAVSESLPEDPTEARLLQLLGGEPLHIDELRARCGLPAAEVGASLAMLELKGRARQVGGMQYVRVRERGAGYRVD